MSKKIKILSAVLVFWFALFITWEWWNSYPKQVFKPTLKVTSTKEGIDSILNQAMSTYLLPGISVAIVQHGKVLYLNAFGYDNLETKDSLTIESLIPVASLSKIFTAIGLANALDEKNLHSTDSLRVLKIRRIDSFPSVANLQFQNLLTHHSGIRDKNISERIFSLAKSHSLNQWGEAFLKTGTKFHSDSILYTYADTNYDLLGYVLSQATSLSFDSVMQQQVLIPSGMVNSRYISSWPIAGLNMTGYQKTFIWKRLEPKRISFPILPSPSSGLLTTTQDMSLALIHLLRGEMGIYQKALLWLTREGKEVPLGFQKTHLGGRDWVGHFGGQAGYASMLFYSREADTGIFLFSNSKDKTNFRSEVANQVISYIFQ